MTRAGRQYKQYCGQWRCHRSRRTRCKVPVPMKFSTGIVVRCLLRDCCDLEGIAPEEQSEGFPSPVLEYRHHSPPFAGCSGLGYRQVHSASSTSKKSKDSVDLAFLLTVRAKRLTPRPPRSLGYTHPSIPRWRAGEVYIYEGWRVLRVVRS